MSYFQLMGSVWHTLPDGTKILLNDITSFATLSRTWRQKTNIQLPYSIGEGELPHMISNRLYGSVDYWWLILLMNDIYDLDEQWPRSYEALNKYIDAKYPDNSRSDVHHYIDSNGLIVDLLSLRIELGLTDDSEVINVANIESITIEDFEFAVNESKKSIILIDPDFIPTIQKEFEEAMAS